MASTSSGQASLAELWPARSRHGSQRLKRTKPKKKGQGGDSHQSTVKKDAIRWRCRLQYLIGCFEKELKYLNIQVKKLTGRTPSTSTSKRRLAAKGSIGLTSFIKRTLGRPSINKQTLEICMRTTSSSSCSNRCRETQMRLLRSRHKKLSRQVCP